MKALIITDVQNDFLPGGALGIPGAGRIIPIINRIMPYFEHVLATQDWHPKGHVSFASTHKKKVGDIVKIGDLEQILWPDHCIQGSQGADFPKSLKRERIEAIFQKGGDLKIDSYSTFFDNARKKETGLEDYLRKKAIQKLYFVGLATDYCVLYSVRDALELGFDVWVIRDCCCAINLKPGDEEKALGEMAKMGARVIQSQEIEA